MKTRMDVIVQVRMRSELWEMVKKAAEEDDVAASQWIRWAIRSSLDLPVLVGARSRERG